MPSTPIDRDTVTGEALFILRNLKENGRQGRSNKLADVKSLLEPSVTLEFDSYFFFLRKFHYIAMDREAQLKLTDLGEQVIRGDSLSKFNDEVGNFFGDQLADSAEPTSGGITVGELRQSPPPAPPDEDLLEEQPMPPPPPPGRGRKSAPDDSFVPPVPPAKLEPELRAPPPPPFGSAQASKGTELDQRYTKFDVWGSGPLGTVYKGRHNALGLDIAVKELKDIFGYFSFLQRGEVIKRLKKELCAQAQVRHPNVVAVLDQNIDVARPYFILEALSGSLRERLDAAGDRGLPVPLAMRYFLQLCYALRAAHAQGLLHHNLKPENVLFDSMGNAKLGDFGMGRVIEVDASKGMPQVFVGTGGMAYMAPELITRGKEAGPSADVYGLGILLYHMLTGQIPGRRSPLPSEVNNQAPSKLDPIFDKMTQDRIDARYPDIDSMLEEFYGAFSDGEYLAKGDLILWSEAPKA